MSLLMDLANVSLARKELDAAFSAYLEARNAALCVRADDIVLTPEWDALGAAHDHLQAVERSYHSRRAARLVAERGQQS